MIKPDERKHPRVDVNKDFNSLEAFITEYVSNLSKGGVFIKSKRPLPVGTLVNLSFTLLLDEIEIVEGEGQVVRVVLEPEEEAGMGVVFLQLTPQSHALLSGLLP